MRKKIVVYGLTAITVIVLGVVIMALLNPLRKPEGKIKESMLELTPIGTSMEDTIRVIENHKKWKTRYIDDENGYESPEDEKIIGEKSIRVLIGEYRNIFVTSVTVFWGFDENSKLIDIYVS